MRRMLLVLVLCVYGASAFAERNFNAEFIEFGMNGDYESAEKVLDDWYLAEPDQTIFIDSMGQMLSDWKADDAALASDPYPSIAEAIIDGNYADASQQLAAAKNSGSYNAELSNTYIKWIDRFTSTDDPAASSEMMMQFAEFEMNRSLQSLSQATHQLGEVTEDFNSQMQSIDDKLDALKTELESLDNTD